MVGEIAIITEIENAISEAEMWKQGVCPMCQGDGREWPMNDDGTLAPPTDCHYCGGGGNIVAYLEDDFTTEACRLWLYGSEVAIYQAARYFASKVMGVENLRFVADQARRLATALDELAQELQEEKGADSV